MNCSQDFPTGSLAVLILVWTLAILALSAPLFFLLPRVSLAIRHFPISPARLISGFSETVELGAIGSIQKSRQAVMKIRVDAPPEMLPPDLKWRGTDPGPFRRQGLEPQPVHSEPDTHPGRIFQIAANHAGNRRPRPDRFSGTDGDRCGLRHATRCWRSRASSGGWNGMPPIRSMRAPREPAPFVTPSYPISPGRTRRISGRHPARCRARSRNAALKLPKETAGLPNSRAGQRRKRILLMKKPGRWRTTSAARISLQP